MQQETIITKMPSVEKVKEYFQFIVNAGIPERIAEEQKEKKAN
ncbi:hypothetical protein [Aneurinibacillus terranovensis]|nr:hypothetical protein [Aneurinibacillus terranovensis]